MPRLVDSFVAALLTYGIHSFAACAIALVARLVRRPQDRDLLWKVALTAPFITAAAVLTLSAAGANDAFIDLAELLRRTSNIQLPGREVKVRMTLHDGAGSSVIRQFSDPVTTALSIAAITIALCVVVVALIRLAGRRRALRRAVSARRQLGVLSAIARGTPVHLSAAAELQSPVALGVAEVCLPAEVAEAFSERHRESLIAHEIAHLERRDPMWFFAAELIAALSAFQPLVFIVARAFRRDVEFICDETAVRRTSDRQSLIGALALLASPFDPRSPLHGAATAYDGSPLVARAEHIAALSLGSAAPRTTRRSALLAAAVLVALLCAVPVVSAAPRLNDLPLDPAAALRDARRTGRTVTVDRTVINRVERTVMIVH